MDDTDTQIFEDDFTLSFTCEVVFTSILVDDETCPDAADGAITINAACTGCEGLEYSIDGGLTFQADNTFSGLADGEYDIVAQNTGAVSCVATSQNTVAAGVDAEAPVPDNPFLGGIVGNCEVSVSAPTATDACAGTITGTTTDPTTYTDQGTYDIIWSYDDGNGNISTQTQTVIVEDNISPIPVCQNITVYLDASGNASITPEQIDNGSTLSLIHI